MATSYEVINKEVLEDKTIRYYVSTTLFKSGIMAIDVNDEVIILRGPAEM